MFLHFFTFAQITSEIDKFYYYYDEKIPLSVNQNKLLIYYVEESENIIELLAQYNIDKEVNLKNDVSNENRKAKIIELLPSMNYQDELEALELSDNVICVEKIIGDSTPVSNTFYVKLHNLSDSTKLVELANSTGSKIIRQIKSRKKWHVLEVDKYSISDCIDVSNIFAESKLFDKVDPGFMINFSPACRTDSQFGSQWAIDDSGVDINACDAWNITTGSSNVTLAIVDEGIDRNHDEWTSSTFTSFSYDGPVSFNYKDNVTFGKGNHEVIFEDDAHIIARATDYIKLESNVRIETGAQALFITEPVNNTSVFRSDDFTTHAVDPTKPNNFLYEWHNYGKVFENSEVSEIKEINLYPNPALEFINVKLDGFGYYNGKIFNTNGGIIESFVIKMNDNIMLNVSDYAPGTYFLSITKPDGTQELKKFIKF